MSEQISPTPPARRRRGCTFWLWVVFGTVLALLLTPLVIGTFLPGEYHGGATAELQQTPQAVWTAIADFERHPLSASRIKEVKALPSVDGMPTWLEETRSSTITVTTVESTEPNALVRRTTDSTTPMESEWRFEIEPTGGGSRVRILQDLSLGGDSWNLSYFRFTFALWDEATRGPRDYLTRLAAGFGESPDVLALDERSE